MHRYTSETFPLKSLHKISHLFFAFILIFLAAQHAAFAASIVQITNPVDGMQVSGVVPIAVTASNSSGVSKVSLYVGGALTATSTGNSLSYNWDTRALTSNWYTLKAVARDTLGNDSATTILVQVVANSSATTVVAPVTTVATTPPVYEGWFDSVDCSGGLVGWGWDKNLPTTPISVDVYADGVQVVSAILANGFRQDLMNASKGDGKHGFIIPIPATMQNGVAHTYTVNFSGTSVALNLNGGVKVATCGTSGPPAPSATAVIEGWVDKADCTAGFTGWVWDKNSPNTALAVDLYADNIKFGWTMAATLRPDLLAAGKGNGNHSFAVAIPANLQDGVRHVYTAKYSGTSITLGDAYGTVKAATCGGATPVPVPTPTTPPAYEGWFDTVDCTTGLTGWAWDKNQPTTPLSVDVYADGAKLGTVLANMFRQDLQTAGKGDGKHSFVIPIPAAMLNGVSHTYTINYNGTTTALNLNGGIKVAMCGAVPAPTPTPIPTPVPTPVPAPTPVPSAAQFEGWFDKYDCKTGLIGWAWDKNQSTTPISVDVLIDGTKLGSFSANGFRQDLLDAGKGNGSHGFIIPIPDTLKNGDMHTYAINYGGSGIALNSSPKTLNCGIPTPPPVPSGKFEVRLLPQPGVGPASPMKHLRLMTNPDTGLIFISSGDWAGAGPWYQSYRQDSYFYDVVNDQWSPAHGYLSTSATDIVPAHPDQMGLAWDSKRKIFWQFPGYQSAPAAETGTSGVLTFNPVTKQWSIPSPMDPMPQLQYEPVKFAQYDAMNDQLIQLGDDKSAHFSPSTGKWTVQYYVNNGNGNRLIKGNYNALVDREIWTIDSRYNNLVKYNIDTRGITDVEPLPFVPGEEHVNLVFDPVRRALVFMGDYHWESQVNPDGSQMLPPFYVYWLDKPLGSRWEQRQFVQMPDQIRSYADSMVYHQPSGKIMLIGDTWDGNKYFYLYSIN